jgi:hypothetical protein
MPSKQFNCEFNGRPVSYDRDTVFTIQTCHGAKGTFRTVYKFVGELSRAAKWYGAVNIGRGYKKRLVMQGGLVLDREVNP